MSHNDITGDKIATRVTTDAYRDGHDLIFRKKPVPTCRPDGRCQYAIDLGAEGMGHCPPGKCVILKEES